MPPDPKRVPVGSRVTRRRFLGWGGAAGASLVLLACGSDSGGSASSTAPPRTSETVDGAPSAVPSTTTPSDAEQDDSEGASGTPATTVFTAADFAGLGVCALFPELTEGPFPTVTQLERRDITEGGPGHLLRVGVQVVDESCEPIPGATVEIWHCDVDGDYSAYADGSPEDDGGPGSTFLRGSQVANDEGIVEFLTVYPGWYRGRAVHIHAKVHLDNTTVLTTQFLFDDEVNEEILAEGVYAAFGPPDTTNAEDGATGGSAEEDGLLMAVRDDVDIGGSRALIVVGVAGSP